MACLNEICKRNNGTQFLSLVSAQRPILTSRIAHGTENKISPKIATGEYLLTYSEKVTLSIHLNLTKRQRHAQVYILHRSYKAAVRKLFKIFVRVRKVDCLQDEIINIPIQSNVPQMGFTRFTLIID